jgi:hypothetical protein
VYHVWNCDSNAHHGGLRYCSVKARWRQVRCSIPTGTMYTDAVMVPFPGGVTVVMLPATNKDRPMLRPAAYV